MNLIFLIIGLSLCTFTTILSIVLKNKKSAITALFSKIIASFCFVLLAVLLGFSKNQVGYYASMPICLIIIGLVLSVIADFLLEAKTMYEFHQKQYLVFGMTCYCIAQVFNIVAILTFVNTQINLSNFIVTALIITAVCLLLTLAYYLISTKVIKLKYQKHSIIFILYCLTLIVSTILSCYFAIALKNYYMLILAFAFVLFFIFNVMLSLQHLGQKQKDKNYVSLSNAIYYIAQVLLALFIYFV